MRESSVSLGADSHPDLDQWVAYHEGELVEHEEDRLRSHLSVCKTCVSTVLDLNAFNNFGECEGNDLNTVSEFEMAAAWRAMKAVLPKKSRSNRPVRVPMSLAASFLVGILGLSLWGVVQHQSAKDLRRQMAARSTPQTNLAIRDLEPNMVTRSGSSTGPTILRQDEFSALVMLPSEWLKTYDIEISNAAGTMVWSGSELVPDPELGTLTLGLPPGFLRSGSYRLRLSGGDPKIVLDDDLSIEVLP